MLLGAAAGILFGVSDISIKALTGTVPGDLLLDRQPVDRSSRSLASIAAFYASARGLQVGEGVSVIAITAVARQRRPRSSAASSCSATRSASDAFAIVARACAFMLVIVAAALMPAPMRAASRTA